MDKIKLAYLASIAIIAMLLLFIGSSLSQHLVGQSMPENSSVVHYGKLVVTDNKSFVSYSITNNENKSVNYTVRMISGVNAYDSTQQLGVGESITQSLHIFGEMMLNSNFTIEIYKENETTPFDSNRYILR